MVKFDITHAKCYLNEREVQIRGFKMSTRFAKTRALHGNFTAECDKDCKWTYKEKEVLPYGMRNIFRRMMALKHYRDKKCRKRLVIKFSRSF